MLNLNAFSSFSIRLMPLTTPSHSLGPVVTIQKYWLLVWRDEVKATLGRGHEALISDINELSKNILCSTSVKDPISDTTSGTFAADFRVKLPVV